MKVTNWLDWSAQLTLYVRPNWQKSMPYKDQNGSKNSTL